MVCITLGRRRTAEEGGLGVPVLMEAELVKAEEEGGFPCEDTSENREWGEEGRLEARCAGGGTLDNLYGAGVGEGGGEV